MSRPAIALVGGPRDGWWYFEDSWQELRRSAEYMAEVHKRGPRDAASWPLGYRATTDLIDNPNKNLTIVGTVWRWKP